MRVLSRPLRAMRPPVPDVPFGRPHELPYIGVTDSVPAGLQRRRRSVPVAPALEGLLASDEPALVPLDELVA